MRAESDLLGFVATLLDENPSEDRVKGFLAGFWEHTFPDSFQSLIYDICGHGTFLFLNNGASSFLKDIFDQVPGDTRYLVDLPEFAVIAVENIEEFVAGIAGFQKAAFDFFQQKRGVESLFSPASWHNLRYLDISNIDEEVYEEIFDDLGQDMEVVPCTSPSKVIVDRRTRK